MNNKYKLDQLVSLLKYNYPSHPAVFESCSNGCKRSARNGGECAVCVAEKLEKLVGNELVCKLHLSIAQESRIYCKMVEKVERQGGIENIY